MEMMCDISRSNISYVEVTSHYHKTRSPMNFFTFLASISERALESRVIQRRPKRAGLV